MEAAAPPVTTGSKTMADLFGQAAEIHGEHTFARHKVGDEWRDVGYAEAWDQIREIGLGLLHLLAHLLHQGFASHFPRRLLHLKNQARRMRHACR